MDRSPGASSSAGTAPDHSSRIAPPSTTTSASTSRRHPLMPAFSGTPCSCCQQSAIVRRRRVGELAFRADAETSCQRIAITRPSPRLVIARRVGADRLSAIRRSGTSSDISRDVLGRIPAYWTCCCTLSSAGWQLRPTASRARSPAWIWPDRCPRPLPGRSASRVEPTLEYQKWPLSRHKRQRPRQDSNLRPTA